MMMEKLSEDLLYVVFLRALPSDFSWREPGSQPSIRTVAPFNLSLVCSSWRAMILPRTSLWSSITIEDHPKCVRRVDQFCRIIEAWFRLSGTSPLTIRLRLGRQGDKSPGDLPIHLLNLFHQECHRWKDVDMRIYNNSLQEFNNDTLHLSASSHLSFLSLHFSRANQVIARVDISPLVVGDSSNLQVLNLGVGALVRAAPHRDNALHLPNLRELTFEIERDSDLDDSLSILSASPCLQKLRLVDARTAPATLTSQRIVFLQSLTDFTLDSRAPRTTRRLLGLLVCSALKTFTFHTSRSWRMMGGGPPMQFYPTLDVLRFLSRSRPPLVALEVKYDIQGAMLREQQLEHANALEELLRLVSDTLERLTCREAIVNGTLMELLTDRCTGDTARDGNDNTVLLCPLLSAIYLSRYTLFSSGVLRNDAVEEMIVSRWKSGEGALKEVKLRLPGFEKFAEESVRLRACVEEGLYLSH